MRAYLFRGQTRRYGEKVRMGDGMKLPSRWVYGGVLQGTGSYSIIYGSEDPKDKSSANLEKWGVYTDTLGQYTEINDKHGTFIFEGDIVSFKTTAYFFPCGVVEYSHEHARFVVKTEKGIYPMDENFEYEVIGNVYDDKLAPAEEPGKCRHCLAWHTNELGEDEIYCDLTARWMNVSLGDCLGNCESEEVEKEKDV